MEENIVKHEKSPKVFISYSWAEPEYSSEWVSELAIKLRNDGIDVDIDSYHDSPPEGWTSWMINQIKSSDFVLVLSTKSYYDVVNSGNVIELGNGRRFEGKLIQTEIYSNSCINSKFIPLIPPNGHRDNILDVLKDYTPYYIQNDYEKLVKRLRGKEPQTPPLRKREIKSLFVDFINPILWSEAEWCGIGYSVAENEIPFLRFKYRNLEAAIKLFAGLIERLGKGNNKGELGISIITKENNAGIIVHIYPVLSNVIDNIESESSYAIDRSITSSRYFDFNDLQNSDFPKVFEENYGIYNSCFIVPSVEINGVIEYSEKLKIMVKNVRFIKYSDIKSLNDIDIAVNPELVEELRSKLKR